MKSIVSFFGGIIFALVLLVLTGYFAVKAGFVPANADSKPTALERWVAKTALNAALERDAKGLTNPVQPSDENLVIGVHLYAENCAICHRASDAKSSNLAQGSDLLIQWNYHEPEISWMSRRSVPRKTVSVAVSPSQK